MKSKLHPQHLSQPYMSLWWVTQELSRRVRTMQTYRPAAYFALCGHNLPLVFSVFLSPDFYLSLFFPK